MPDFEVERRVMVGLTPEEKDRLMNHMALEEARVKQDESRFAAIEADLRPIKKLYYAALGSIGIGGVLLSVLLYIYHNDRETMKRAVDAIGQHSEVIVKMMARAEVLEHNLRWMEERIKEKD